MNIQKYFSKSRLERTILQILLSLVGIELVMTGLGKPILAYFGLTCTTRLLGYIPISFLLAIPIFYVVYKLNKGGVI